MDRGRAVGITFVIAVLGDSGVGKTKLVCRRVGDQDPPKNKPTAQAINIITETYDINDTTVTVQYLDAWGADSMRQLTCKICAGTAATIFVFDVSNKESFENIPKWLAEMQKPNKKTLKILIGNKCDLADAPLLVVPPIGSSTSSYPSSSSSSYTSSYPSVSSGLPPPSPSSSSSHSAPSSSSSYSAPSSSSSYSAPSSSSSYSASSSSSSSLSSPSPTPQVAATRKVTRLEAESFAIRNEMKYFETSALNYTGVNEPFEYLMDTIMSKNKGGPSQKIVKGGLSFGKGNLAGPGLKKIQSALNENPAYKKADVATTADWLEKKSV